MMLGYTPRGRLWRCPLVGDGKGKRGQDRSMSHSAVAAVFHGAGSPLEFASIALPTLAEVKCLCACGCVRLRQRFAHVSGKRKTPTPTILGHEILGESLASVPTSRALFGRQALQLGQQCDLGDRGQLWRVFFSHTRSAAKVRAIVQVWPERLTDAHAVSGGLASASISHANRRADRARVAGGFVAAFELCDGHVAAAIRVGAVAGWQDRFDFGAGMLGLNAAAMGEQRGPLASS